MLEKEKIKAKTPLSTLGVKGVAVLSIIIILSAFLCFPVSAKQTSSNTFVMSCGTPSTGDSTGYLEILLKNPSTGDYTSRVFMWSAIDSTGTLSGENFVYETDLSLHVYIIKSDDGDVVRFFCPNYATGISVKIYSLDAFNQRYIGSTIGYGQSKDIFDYDTSYDIVSYHIYGNYSLSVTGSLPMTEFYVLYAESGVIFNAITSGQQDQANQIIQGQQEQTDKITQNDDENTQAIIDNQNQLAEQEKQETQEQSNSSVDDVSNALPDYSGSLLSAFTNLVKPMLHENSSCVLTTPAITIPQINGLIDKPITLLKGYTFDFADYIAYIPNYIMLIIQSVLTVVLFIFCYKEFYGIIEYVMTLRGKSE